MSERDPSLPARLSAVRLPDQWFIACASKALRSKPLALRLQGTPLVLFRDGEGKAHALEDRCPHRNVPLSEGRVRQGQLECRYHGWRFDGAGACKAIPGLVGEPAETRSRNAVAYATVESDGFVWVYSTPGEPNPARRPFRFPFLDDPRYTTVRRRFQVRATMHAVVENALDVPHTAFLHGGLFRTEKPRGEIEVRIRRTAEAVEAEYIGEPRPEGLAGKLLAPRGGTVVHFDRFLLPSIAQVEYRLGDASHLLVTSALTPLSELETALHAVVTFRLPLPGWLVRPFVAPVAGQIFAQDARILDQQTDNILRFGGEQFSFTEADVLGAHILLLLRAAEKGDAGRVSPLESALKLRV